MENQNLQNQINDLKKEIENLKSPSTIPLSIENALISRGFIKYDSDLLYYGGAGGQLFNNIFVRYGNTKSLIPIAGRLISFIVNTSTDTCYSPNHGFSEDQQLLLYTTDTLPSGLDLVTSYWVKNTTDDTFQLSSDGSTIDNITTVGVGTHYAEFFT